MPLKNPNRWLLNETVRWTSLLKKFREEKKIDEHFEIMINNLTLEDLIALKLELSTKTLGSPVFGQPIWDTLHVIVEDAVLKFAISTTQTTSEAAAFLGISQKTLFRKTKQYGMWNYFDQRYLEKRNKKMEANRLKRLEQNNATKTEGSS